MGRIARRAFLFGSVAIAGGVAFGVYAVRREHDNPLAKRLAAGEATFNPWVKIGPAGITLIAPHTDVGQGARSMQALLIAEEMDLEWGQFAVEPGPPAPAYWNTATADEGVPFRARDHGFMAASARGAVGALIKLVGMQVTGGSSSVPDSWDKLRRAGSIARETLKQAAADRYGVPVATLGTEKAAVVFPDGRRVAYTALATDAARVDPVDGTPLRDPSSWRLIGKEVQRLDIVGKSTGTTTFGIDLAIDGMVNATVRLNPRRGGAMEGYDASAARHMPGVLRILEVTNGVAVVADNTWNAFRAADAIDIQWGPAAYPAMTEEHWSEIEASFVDERLDREWRHEGDVPAALARASERLDLEYRAPHLAHQPLEPIGALVLVEQDQAEVWVSHQIPRIAQQMVADIAGVDVDRVALHNQYCGGSFGHRLEFENVRYAAEVAAQMRGTPVKLTFSREEDFAQDFVRQNAISRISGTVGEGRVQTLDIAVASPSVLASQLRRMNFPSAGADAQIPAGVWDAPYAFENLRVRAYRSPELVPTSSWRSVGASTGGFFLEGALDELIVAAGADPLLERIRLCDDPVARQLLEGVGEMSSWGSDLGRGRGRGVALVFSFGVHVAEVVEVTNTPRGIRIDKVYVAADVGRVVDPANFENQVQGAVIWGLGHAMNCEMTYSDGMAEQRNYHVHAGMRMYQCPAIEVRAYENSERVGGIGEPPVPPAAPALANAIFQATDKRLREMPFNKFVKFV